MQQRFDSSDIRPRRACFGLCILVLCINWANSYVVFAQEQLELKNHAQFYMICAGYLYGVSVAASQTDNEELLRMSTLLTNTAFVLARDSGETEEELRKFLELGTKAGNEVPTTEAGWANKERTIQSCSLAAKSIRDQLGQ